MGILDRLFGRKAPAPDPAAAASPAPPGAAAGDPRVGSDPIRVHDAYGREVLVSREDWREKILPSQIDRSWDDPDRLAAILIQSLGDGFSEALLRPAERLARIDPNPERGAVLLALVYKALERFDMFEQVLLRHMRKHGESGIVLTNLAIVDEAWGNEDRAIERLWRGLQLDPNQGANAVALYESIYQRRGGEVAAQDALRRIAAIPGSWKAQLRLAWYALKRGQRDEAVALYREALARAGRPAPAELLVHMSSDLGGAGQLSLLLELVEPHFDPAVHGLPVGQNLMRASLELGVPETARQVLKRLYALKNPTLIDVLGSWEVEIDRALASRMSVDASTPVKVAMLHQDGPLWLDRDAPAAELFPPLAQDAPVVTLLGCTVTRPPPTERPGLQTTEPLQRKIEQQDWLGVMSRALPLLLAERVETGSRTRTRTLVPWVMQAPRGFFLAGVPWQDSDAVNHALQPQPRSEYVAVLHLEALDEPWTARLRLLRTRDSQRLGELAVTLSPEAPADGTWELAEGLLSLLRSETRIEARTPPSAYAVPTEPGFSAYLLNLNHLLAMRCSSTVGADADDGSGERHVVDRGLRLCLESPGSVSVRILLAETLRLLRRVRPDVLPEFEDRVWLLQREHPLSEPAQGLIDQMLREAFAR